MYFLFHNWWDFTHTANMLQNEYFFSYCSIACKVMWISRLQGISLYGICCATYWVKLLINIGRSVLSYCWNINSCFGVVSYMCSWYWFQLRFRRMSTTWRISSVFVLCEVIWAVVNAVYRQCYVFLIFLGFFYAGAHLLSLSVLNAWLSIPDSAII